MENEQLEQELSSSSPPPSGTGNGNEDDAESVLDISEQINRPEDIPIQQQTINAWHPILDPNWMIFSYLILAAIMVPFGYYLERESEKIVEVKHVYDMGIKTGENPVCESIGENYNANQNCTLTFQVPEDMKPPVLVYYELTNFHQNYRKYTTSRDDYQLTGRVGDQSAVDAANCEPINILGETVINPCGLIANTFFNDKFTLMDTAGAVDDQGNKLVMNEEGIAWESDLKHRFDMPDGYQQKLCEVNKCDLSCCQDLGFSCSSTGGPAIDPKNASLCYAYDYPEQSTTQYLYQTYPSVISPLEHVNNEHFVVWMRVAATPNFRKLYGYIDQTIPAGTTLEFDVNMNYVVESFNGTKSLTLTTNSMWGTKDPTIGITIYSIGYFCLACGIFFALKHWLKPRKIADRKYLHYKEE